MKRLYSVDVIGFLVIAPLLVLLWALVAAAVFGIISAVL